MILTHPSLIKVLSIIGYIYWQMAKQNEISLLYTLLTHELFSFVLYFNIFPSTD